MPRLILLTLWLVLSAPLIGVAADADLQTVIQALELPFRGETAADRRINSFQGEFVQLSRIASIDREQRGEGEVFFRFAYPAADSRTLTRFHWSYRRPEKQQIISDGKLLWVYQPDNQQVVKSDISQVMDNGEQNPLTLLTRLGYLAQDFVIEWAPVRTDVNGDYRLLLQPRQASRYIEHLELVVSAGAVVDWQRNKVLGRRLPLAATVVTDSQGNRTAIEFDQVQVNIDLPNDLFEFEPPPDVDVLTPREISW